MLYQLSYFRIVTTVGFEPTPFIPTRTNTLRIMTFQAYTYLHYRVVLHCPQVYPGIHPDASYAAVQRFS